MISNSVSLTAVGYGRPIPIKSRTFYQGVGLLVTLSSNATGVVYSVEVSGDSQNGPDPTHWNLHDELVGLSANANSNIAFPVTFVRLHVSALTTGSVNFAVVQCE